MNATTSTPRQQILEALAARAAATAPELATDTGISAALVRQLLVEAAVIGAVKRAGMARTDRGLEVIWTHGGQR